jgi:hypothetical protein
MKKLLEYKADPNARCSTNGDTPLVALFKAYHMISRRKTIVQAITFVYNAPHFELFLILYASALIQRDFNDFMT